MRAAWKPVLLACTVLAISGCGSTGKKMDGDVAIEDRGAVGMDGAMSQGVGMGGDFQGMAIDDPNSPLYQRVIYFEFDSSEVRAADRDLVANHAAFLTANPNIRVTLEGHGDERGSREYNIGLGDRRAQAVRRMMELQGVSPSQLSTVSYGEEKPVVEGHDESAWSQNRRVELMYSGQ